MAEVASHLRRVGEFALDTEADSYFVYQVKLCLLQVSTREQHFLIDPLGPLDLAPLGEVLADPDVLKVLHAGANDIALLAGEYGHRVRNLADTMVAAQVLGEPRTGLAALLEQRFGVQLEKQFQTSDWRRRPLEEGQLHYAVLDTRYLLELMDQMRGELRDTGRWAEASEEFELLEEVAPTTPRSWDPFGFLRVRGARDLDATALRVLRELHQFREERARQLDRPPQRVIRDEALISWARRPRLDARTVRSMLRGPLREESESILQLVRRARSRGALPRAELRRPSTGEAPLTADQKLRFDRLRRWRTERAERRRVDPSRIATSETLRANRPRPPADCRRTRKAARNDSIPSRELRRRAATARRGAVLRPRRAAFVRLDFPNRETSLPEPTARSLPFPWGRRRLN